mmetsp:Transcript_34307/g.55211  ORF Transcript_34307/g.55211 Transcript_34307/m.55211 type:complete len:90 (+) Transcript_34307:907-1176(+)
MENSNNRTRGKMCKCLLPTDQWEADRYNTNVKAKVMNMLSHHSIVCAGVSVHAHTMISSSSTLESFQMMRVIVQKKPKRHNRPSERNTA